MTQTTYNKVSGLLFGVVGLAHAVRAASGWPVTINTWAVPVWASWVVAAVLLFLAYQAWSRR